MRGRSRAFRTGSADMLSALGIPAASLAPHFGPARTVCSRVHHLWIGSVPSLRIERYASQAPHGEIQGNGVWIDQIQGKPPSLNLPPMNSSLLNFTLTAHPPRAEMPSVQVTFPIEGGGAMPVATAFIRHVARCAHAAPAHAHAPTGRFLRKWRKAGGRRQACGCRGPGHTAAPAAPAL